MGVRVNTDVLVADHPEPAISSGPREVEVVGVDPPLLLHEVVADNPGLGRTVLGGEDPLELLGGDPPRGRGSTWWNGGSVS